MMSDKWFVCSKCGKKPPEVMDFHIGDQVVCFLCEPPSQPMKPQLWYCETCGVMGAAMYEEHADVMYVVNAMGNQHRQASPKCENGVMGLPTIVVEDIREPFVMKPHEIAKG